MWKTMKHILFSILWENILHIVFSIPWKTIARRLLILIPQLLVLSIIIFLLAQLMPGDALRGLITPAMTADQVAHLRYIHGMDNPWYIQYVQWLRNIVVNRDFGNSLSHLRPVTDIIGETLANTMRLSFLTTIFTYMLAIPLGILAGRKSDTFIDKTIMVYTFVALSLPTVVLAIVNLMIFGFTLNWFPTSGSVDVRAVAAGGWTYFTSRLHHLILPAATLAVLSTIGIIYFLRSEIIDHASSDFVLTARSKGVPEKKIYTRHILRNSFLPIASTIGFVVSGLFAGSIFIETTFSYPGMGQLFINSIIGRDFPVANALIMFYAVLTVLAILISDIIVTFIDPRIRIK